jgi:hypothetical protein
MYSELKLFSAGYAKSMAPEFGDFLRDIDEGSSGTRTSLYGKL